MISYKIKTAPTSSAVTVADAKLWTKIDESADDSLVQWNLDAAEEHINSLCGLALLDTVYEMRLTSFPQSDRLVFPVAPLSSVDSIKYYDTNEEEQTLSSDDYIVDTLPRPGVAQLAPTASWPNTAPRVDAITVEFTAGYGGASDVPRRIKNAILMLASHWYIHREAYGACDGSLPPTPAGFSALITAFRRSL